MLEGRVTVNGEPKTDLATQVASSDQVRVDGQVVRTQEFVYLLLNKPADFLTTRSDERSRKTIYQLLPGDLLRGFGDREYQVHHRTSAVNMCAGSSSRSAAAFAASSSAAFFSTSPTRWSTMFLSLRRLSVTPLI